MSRRTDNKSMVQKSEFVVTLPELNVVRLAVAHALPIVTAHSTLSTSVVVRNGMCSQRTAHLTVINQLQITCTFLHILRQGLKSVKCKVWERITLQLDKFDR